ncbi:MAG: signal peptidase I [Pseudomonadota bacterium]
MESINFPLILVSACLIGTVFSLLHRLFFKNSLRRLADNVNSFLPVLWIVLVLRSFIAEPFQIPSGSMIPTLKIGDFILVNKFTYGLRLPVLRTKVFDLNEPERGDVMVFFPPHDKRYFIKRVIGVPGDVIKYVDKRLTVNGEPLAYVNPREEDGSTLYEETINGVEHDVRVEPHNYSDNLPMSKRLRDGFTVRDGHYFMMGDNRDRSSDSRVWGDVPEENIVGKAFFVWMHWSGLPDFSQARTIQ